MVEVHESAPASVAEACAGDTWNTLYYLNALLRQRTRRCRFCSALGDDPTSHALRKRWHEAGIDTTLVRTLAGKSPGLYRIHIDPHGERHFSYQRSDSAARCLLQDADDAALVAALHGEDLVYFSAISLAILPPADRARLLDIIAACRAEGTRIAFDDNYRPALWADAAEAAQATQQALAGCDMALVSFSDQNALFADRSVEATLQRLQGMGIAEIVVRNGALPGVAAADGSVIGFVPPHCAAVLDTTGAGDSFNAAYLAARLSGYPIDRSVQSANALAARVIQTRGAILPLDQVPTLQELLAD